MIWLTRGKKPLLNRRTGQTAVGEYSARVTGPDGISDSALYFDGTKKLVLPLKAPLDGDFTLQLGLKLVVPGVYYTIFGDANPTAPSLYILGANEYGSIRFNLGITRGFTVMKNGALVAENQVIFSETFDYRYAIVSSVITFETISAAVVLYGYEYHDYGVQDLNVLPTIGHDGTNGIKMTIPADANVPFQAEWDEGDDHYLMSFTQVINGWQYWITKAV